ncbi:hypothetical protein HY407_04145 [Candidatus Gottesmanbacteria bacterium]|nr:hypothetical protein [Candidatus Gottesmanbacteria bacterium]
MHTTTIDYRENERFSLLRNQVEQKRAKKINLRLARNPSPTTTETILGAFVEMYEPHLLPIIHALLKKGYRVDPTSGFCGEFYNCQALNGTFTIDYILANKLTKIGYKTQSDTNSKSIKFWPDSANLDLITQKYQKIVDTLPSRNQPIEPSQSLSAKKFRMTYIPKNLKLKRQRLFEILMFGILKSMAVDIKTRLTKNPIPDEKELKMGVFVEMIEPQVRDAILQLNKKGYTTDASGFMNKANSQIIDGDFIVSKFVIAKLRDEGVRVETNHSGYTRLSFTPSVAKIRNIKDQWLKIVSFLPDKGKSSDPSMTQKAREFRIKYS